MAEVYSLSSDWIGFAMVPAALTSSLLGRKGGKLADLKGNAFLFQIASLSLITCFPPAVELCRHFPLVDIAVSDLR